MSVETVATTVNIVRIIICDYRDSGQNYKHDRIIICVVDTVASTINIVTIVIYDCKDTVQNYKHSHDHNL